MAIDAVTQCNLSPSFTLRLEHKDLTKMRIMVWEAKTLEAGKVLIRSGSLGTTYLKEVIKDRAYFERNAPQKIAKGYVVKRLVIGSDG